MTCDSFVTIKLQIILGKKETIVIYFASTFHIADELCLKLFTSVSKFATLNNNFYFFHYYHCEWSYISRKTNVAHKYPWF